MNVGSLPATSSIQLRDAAHTTRPHLGQSCPPAPLSFQISRTRRCHSYCMPMWILHKMFRVDNFKFNLICQLIQVVASDRGGLSATANFARHGPTQPHFGNENTKNSPINRGHSRRRCSPILCLCDGDLTVYVLISLGHKLGVDEKNKMKKTIHKMEV